MSVEAKNPDAAQGYPEHETDISIVYEVENAKVIAKTIYGRVRIMRHRATGDSYAVKSSQESLYANAPPGHENPDAEAVILHRISALSPPPSILTPVESYRWGGWFHLVLPMLNGGELFGEISKNGAVRIDYVQMHARTLLQALKWLHDVAGLAHMDIKPENIMLTASGMAVLIDFGMSIAARPGVLMAPGRRGTRAYMSPEVYQNLPYCPIAADVYSLGMALFVESIGTPPYNVPEQSDRRMQMILEGNLAKLFGVWNLAPDPLLVDFMQRMLRPEAARASVDELLMHPFLAQDYGFGPIGDAAAPQQP